MLLLLVAAGVFGALAVREPAAPDERPAAGALASPVWSARRVPGAIVDPMTAVREVASADGLQQALDAEALRYDRVCFVVRRGATVLASRNAAAGLIPASTQKLLVSAAALASLGPGFRFETRAVATGTGPAIDRLIVVGSGDPVIRTAPFVDQGISTPLDGLADAIVAAGVRRVGTLVADDGRYDRQRYVPTWKPAYREDLDVGPLGALVVDQGVTLASGKPALVDDPARQLADDLAELLQARGVTVDDTGRGSAPGDASTVATVTSQPLETIVGWMLAVSDNSTAELLTKELGVRLRDEGSTTAGTAAVREVLGRLGVTLAGEPTVDGSGLDRDNRLTCGDLAAVLALGDRPDLHVLRDVLPGDPRPNGDGTVRAKGGYLDDVTALAGVAGRDQPMLFAFVANGGVPKPSQNAVVGMRRVADLLAAYRPPERVPDALVPGPLPVGR